MCNIIINELGIYDEIFLKTKTNAPYLIGPDKRYVRDRVSNKPLVWDPVEENAKTYDDPKDSCREALNVSPCHGKLARYHCRHDESIPNFDGIDPLRFK
jgi:hypothetical protein